MVLSQPLGRDGSSLGVVDAEKHERKLSPVAVRASTLAADQKIEHLSGDEIFGTSVNGGASHDAGPYKRRLHSNFLPSFSTLGHHLAPRSQKSALASTERTSTPQTDPFLASSFEVLTARPHADPTSIRPLPRQYVRNDVRLPSFLEPPSCRLRESQRLPN